MKQTYIDKHGIETQHYYRTRVKLIKSGSLIEIYDFGRDIFLGSRSMTQPSLDDLEIEKNINNFDSRKILKASARRAKRNIKRLINTNCFCWFKNNGKPYKPITLTLTFEENIQNLKNANYEFTKFIRRLNYETNKIEGRDIKISSLKYLGVFEIQKRGAIHYHLIFFNLPYINDIYNKMRTIWGLGRINVGGKNKSLNKVNGQIKLKKIIEYFTKYIQKSIFENDFKHQKKYIASRNLLKPIEQYSEDVVYLIRGRLYDDLMAYHYDSETDENSTPIPYIKTLKYTQYDLSTNNKLSTQIDDMLASYSFDSDNANKQNDNIINDNFDISKSKKMSWPEIEELLTKKPEQPPLPELK